MKEFQQTPYFTIINGELAEVCSVRRRAFNTYKPELNFESNCVYVNKVTPGYWPKEESINVLSEYPLFDLKDCSELEKLMWDINDKHYNR